MIQADLVVRNIASLVTCVGPIPRCGDAQKDVGEMTRGAVAAREGKLVFVGAERDLDDAVALLPEAQVLDAGEGTVLPEEHVPPSS